MGGMTKSAMMTYKLHYLKMRPMSDTVNPIVLVSVNKVMIVQAL